MTATTQRVAIARTFGPPEVITLESHDLPPLPEGAVRVAVRSAGLNPVDARRRAGTFGGQPPLIFGGEFAGVVIESHDPQWTPGDDVLSWGAVGAHADTIIRRPHELFAKPARLDWDVAGGFSGVGRSALTALDELGLASGDLIVVHGASGGVGTALVQLAVARGLHVIGTAGPSNQQHVTDLGATAVVYGPGLEARITEAAAGRPIAASIDLAGSAEAGDFAVALQRSGGQAVTLVPETAQSHGVPMVRSSARSELLAPLLEALESGVLSLPVTSVPFTQIVEAHRQMDAKHARGKSVLDLSDNPFLPTEKVAS